MAFALTKRKAALLLFFGAPIILLHCMDYVSQQMSITDDRWQRDLDVYELFSGEGELGRQCRAAGFHVRTSDIMKGKFHDITTPEGFMLSLKGVLRLRYNGLLWLGVPCNSWVFMSSSTTKRTSSEYGIMGDETVNSVAAGNCIAARVALLCMVAARAELVPNRAFTPTHEDFMMDYELECRATTPLKTRQDSYENMNGRRFVDDSSHQYEDPSKLADEVFHNQGRGRPHPPSRSGNKRPRRKTNEAYEPVPYSQKRSRTFTDDFDDGYPRDTCNKLFKVMAFFGFLFGLGAAVVVVMLMLGIMFVPGCDDCKKEIVPSQSSTAQSVGSAQELWRVIKEMKSNLSELNQAIRKKNEIISQLQRRDIEHTGKIVELEQRAAEAFSFAKNYKLNISSLVGPRGPPGNPGPIGPSGKDGVDGRPGKPGLVNMSLCVYRVEYGVPFTAERAGAGQNVIVTENTQERIIGVTCSTEGTTEYNLKSYFRGNRRQYQCICRGQSSVFRATAGRAKCILHYWVCPLSF